MKKDFITINDQEYRVEINMNTVENWERLSGKRLGQFEVEAAQSAKKGGVSTRAMLLWFFCGITEGEDIEGRKFETSFLDFKRMLKPSVMSEFAVIFLRQYLKEKSDSGTHDDVKKKKLNRSRFASFVRLRWVKWVGALLILSFAGLLIFLMH